MKKYDMDVFDLYFEARPKKETPSPPAGEEGAYT
jgi:hypothetical protein